MKFLKIFFNLLFIIAICVPVFANGGGEPGAYLKNGFSSRVNALGNNIITLRNDISSVFFNPANLSENRNKIFSGFWSSYYNDIDAAKYFTIAYAQPIMNFNIGAGLIYYSVDEVEYRTGLSAAPLDIFEYKEMQFITSISKKIVGIDFGVNCKIAKRDYIGFNKTGFGMDFGFAYQPENLHSINFGLMCKDLIPIDVGSNKYPVKFSFGFLYNPDFLKNLNFISTIEKEENDNNLKIFGAVEYNNILRNVHLRSGYNGYNKNLTAGFGIQIQQFTFDYAFEPHSDLGDKHDISVTYKFE